MKDKRTKAQLLQEITLLKHKNSNLQALADDIARQYEDEGANGCRRFTKRELRITDELSEVKSDKSIFKDSLKFILRHAR